MSAVDPGATGLDRAAAEAMDANDPLRAFRERFAIPHRPDGRPVVYLCGNSLGLMPASVPELVQRELDDWAALAVDAHFRGRTPWFSYHEVFRDAGARIVGARPGEVVMMNSLTVNLHLMLVSFYQPDGARTKILIEHGAFPSDQYAVASHVASRGLDPESTILTASPREGERTLRTEDLEDLLARRGPEIAVVMCGGVNYYTGQLLDIERLTAAGRAQGCIVGFDLAHAVGNVPLALHDWDVDFAIWCSYKYLNAGPGAVAGCFVHERYASDASLPRYAGWWGHDPGTRFAMERNRDFVPQPGAAGWQLSNPSILGMAPLRGSLELFDAAGIHGLREKSQRLTGYLEQLLRHLGSSRLEIITPAEPTARGCQLSLRVRGPAGRTLFDAIRDKGIVADYREPDVIRVAPTPLYNTFQDAWEFAEALRSVLPAARPPLAPT